MKIDAEGMEKLRELAETCNHDSDSFDPDQAYLVGQDDCYDDISALLDTFTVQDWIPVSEEGFIQFLCKHHRCSDSENKQYPECEMYNSGLRCPASGCLEEILPLPPETKEGE